MTRVDQTHLATTTNGIVTATNSDPFVPAEKRSVEQQVYQAVERRLKACPYAFVFGGIVADYAAGRLTLRGRVPSFYLKQMLQELLRGIEHVDQFRNEVDVVNSIGLSSERPNQAR